MMRGIYILCEGQTEREFVNKILIPYFNSHQIIDVRPILMSTSRGHKGGDIKYDRLRFNIIELILREHDILVTSFLDFFRLKSDFPKFEEAKQIHDRIQRVDFLEKALAEEINLNRFIPYIQLHEFEGLLFSSGDGFKFLPDLKQANLNKLLLAVDEKENPEELNDGELTAPSKRLEHLIPGFDRNKPFYGGIIAEVNTIESILARCLRFRKWVETLIERVKSV